MVPDFIDDNMLQEETTEMRALHGHNSRRPEGYLGFQGKRVEHGFEGTDGQAKGTGKSYECFFKQDIWFVFPGCFLVILIQVELS